MTIKSTLIVSALAIALPLAPALAGGNGGHGGTVVVHGNGGWHGGYAGHPYYGGGWHGGGGGWGCGWGCGLGVGAGVAALGALAWGLATPGYGYAPPVVVRQPQLVCNQFGQCWYQ